ncbi:hypothetical protein ACIBO5_13285 [Nonomuraea angiospora]|uniref:hypothetical protein n=1 Tax=Nonomuraea angiospora TaxID=46172 RepID=UPI0029A8049E|nr:hypothetical protein [Nonomuraea angiospora]MDX3111207.1 hypothetical protein [Nonomuraea angiospora]
MLADISNILTFAVMGILFLFGVIVTVMARREHGSAAMIGMSGCILLLLGLAFDGFRSFVLYPQLGASIGVEAVTVTNLVSLLFNAGGTALLIWAVVARRKPQPAQPPHGPVQPPHGPGWPQQPPYPQQPYQQQQQPGWQNPQQPPYGQGQS